MGLAKAVSDVRAYFLNPSNHLDDDKEHISPQEIEAAIDKVPSLEGKALLYVLKNGYYYRLVVVVPWYAESTRQISLLELNGYNIVRERFGDVWFAHMTLLKRGGATAEARVRNNQWGIQGKSFSEVIEYFLDPQHHDSSDSTSTKFISPSELRRALASESISPSLRCEMSFIIGAYDLFSALQAEKSSWGPINHYQVISLRDLYAARRGTGYDGEPLNVRISAEIAVFRLWFFGSNGPCVAKANQ